MEYCRLCAKSEKKHFIPILADTPLRIGEKLEKLFNLKISETSNLPKSICIDCFNYVNSFEKFQQTVQESQIVLKIIFNQPDEASTTPVKNSSIPTVELVQHENSNASTQLVQDQQTGSYFIVEEIPTNEINDASVVDDLEIEILSNSHEQSPRNSKRRSKYDRFDCHICKQTLHSNIKFTRHFKVAHQHEEVLYTCYLCKTQVKLYRSYMRHLESHEVKRFKCDQCDKNFKQKVILINHMKTHSSLKTFKCEDCNAIFRQYASLFKHRKQKHTAVDAFHCDVCDKSFVNNSTLLQHQQSKHEAEKTIACSECSMTFASNSAISYHMISAHTNSSVTCKSCDKKFKTLITMKRHFLKFHA